MIHILEIGSSSIFDHEYDKDVYNITKLYNQNKPKWYNELHQVNTFFQNMIYTNMSIDVIVYTLGVLDSDINTTLTKNLVLPMTYFDILKNKCNIHMFAGSVCGLPDGSYPSKPHYELSKKLLYTAVDKIRKDMPNKYIKYLALPGIKSKMTISSSGYDSYMDSDFGYNEIMREIDKVTNAGRVC